MNVKPDWIYVNNPTRRQRTPEIVAGTKITVMFGKNKLTGYTVRPYNDEKSIVLHGRNEAKVVLSGLYRDQSGVLRCKSVG